MHFFFRYSLGYKRLFQCYIIAFHLALLYGFLPFFHRVILVPSSCTVDSILIGKLLYFLGMYIWFWMASLHYYIHHHKIRLTIVESKLITVDEGWHIVNQLLVAIYVLYCELFAHFVVYISIGSIYLVAVFFMFTRRSCIRIAYYTGGLLTVIFMMLIEPVTNPIAMLTIIIIQTFFQWVITYRNKFGRKLISYNIAGCAFISQQLILFYIYQGWYTPQTKSYTSVIHGASTTSNAPHASSVF